MDPLTGIDSIPHLLEAFSLSESQCVQVSVHAAVWCGAGVQHSASNSSPEKGSGPSEGDTSFLSSVSLERDGALREPHGAVPGAVPVGSCCVWEGCQAFPPQGCFLQSPGPLCVQVIAVLQRPGHLHTAESLPPQMSRLVKYCHHCRRRTAMAMATG